MITFIHTIDNPLLEFVKDDPVRPELSKEFRVGTNKFVSCLFDNDISAMVCVSLHDFVPADVDDLTQGADAPDTAIFYTIWSYKSGAGIKLLRNTVSKIKEQYPSVKRFITLSPKTEMARRFHIKNGAIVLRENSNTINYEYLEAA